MFDNANVNIRDKPKAITAEDLIRRFNLDSLAKDRKAIKTLNDGLTKTDTIIENFVNNIAMYGQDQEDGFITSWFFNEVPILENKPYSDFDKDNLSKYINDLYYDKETGKVYQFVNEESIYQWLELDDDYMRESLAIAALDVDTQDNKRNIFFELPTPPYDAGDIWYDGDNINRCRCSRSSGVFHETDWCFQKDYSDNSVLVETKAVLDEFKTEVKRDYVTQTLLETTKNSINASVETKTTEIIQLQKNYSTLASDITKSEEKLASFELNLNEINQEISYFNDQSQAIAKLTTSISEIQAQIGSITDTTVNGNGVGTVQLDNVLTSELLYLQIYPLTEDLGYLNVSPKTVLSNNTKITSRDLLFINTKSNKTIKYTLPCNLYYISDAAKDELIIDYEKQQIIVIHRVGINAETGEKYALAQEKTQFFEYKGINIDEGNYTIKMQSFNSAYINVRALANSIYTSQYPTRVEVNNKISLSESGIRQEVNGKITALDGTVTNLKGSLELKLNIKDLCTELNGSADKITFIGNRFSWQSTYSSMSETGTLKATNVDLSGKITATSGTIGGCSISSGVLKVADANITSINASKITAGTMSADRISGGTIDATKTTVKNLNATNITSGTIDASKITVKNINASNITSGTISTSRLSSSVITTSNLSAQKISASQITTGTMSADRISGGTIDASKITVVNLNASNINAGTINGQKISMTNLNANNLNRGTISACDISVYNSVGFLKMLHGSAYHPFVSALNVARGSGGISFRNSGDRNSTGSQIGQIYADNNVIYISASNGTNVANYLKCGNIGISGVQIDGAQDTWIRMNYSVVLKPNPSGGAYIWGTEDYNKILTSSGSPSTLSIKENVKLKDTSDIPKMLEKINLYDYKYISEVENGKEDYGYIIDYLEKIDGIDKYFKFNNIDRNNIKYKTINHEHLSKFLLGAVIELQKQINNLKERILE